MKFKYFRYVFTVFSLELMDEVQTVFDGIQLFRAEFRRIQRIAHLTCIFLYLKGHLPQLPGRRGNAWHTVPNGFQMPGDLR